MAQKTRVIYVCDFEDCGVETETMSMEWVIVSDLHVHNRDGGLFAPAITHRRQNSELTFCSPKHYIEYLVKEVEERTQD